jgi:hypothetical protein
MKRKKLPHSKRGLMTSKVDMKYTKVPDISIVYHFVVHNCFFKNIEP